MIVTIPLNINVPDDLAKSEATQFLRYHIQKALRAYRVGRWWNRRYLFRSIEVEYPNAQPTKID